MAAHYSILAWKIPWTEEPGGLDRVHRVSKVSDTVEQQQQQEHTYETTRYKEL